MILCRAALAFLFICNTEVIADQLRDPTAQERLREKFDLTFSENDVLHGLFSKGDSRPTIVGSRRVNSIELSVAEVELIASLQGLKSLSLSYATCTDGGFSKLIEMTGLEFLGLAGTTITDESMQRIAFATSLRKIDLRDTDVSEEVAEFIRKKRHIIVLTGRTAASYAAELIRDERRQRASELDSGSDKLNTQHFGLYLGKRKHGEELTLSGVKEWHTRRLTCRESQVSSLQLEELITSSPQLEAIYLERQKVDSRHTEAMSKLTSLCYLRIENCEVTDDAINKLRNCPALRYLHVPGDSITDDCMSGIARIPSLIDINLRGTAVSDDGIFLFKNNPLILAIDCNQSRVTRKAALEVERSLIGGRVAGGCVPSCPK